MKRIAASKQMFLFALIFTFLMTMSACVSSAPIEKEDAPRLPVSSVNGLLSGGDDISQNTSSEQSTADTDLYVRFGDGEAPFALHLYDNDTAAAIARHVGTADWRLPIYHYNDYENWEVMQYYDIPSRYEIPANPEMITSEPAGTVYYSEPNRIVLFFENAEISGEYTPVGYFDYSEEFASAVKNNPVVSGWSNKLILISNEV